METKHKPATVPDGCTMLYKPGMEWSNEKCIEFLQLYKSEPCLWDVRLPTHKNRIVQSDAWRRILLGLSFTATLEDVKSKRNSLMGYYRIHINKYKKSLKCCDDVYTTSWFAFEIMHSFLGPLYTSDCSANEVYLPPDPEQSAECPSPVASSSQLHISSSRTIKRSFSSQSSHQSEEHFESPPETFTHQNSQIHQHEPGDAGHGYDEYDHFGLMIASKIRKIDNFEERETVMNVIQNIVFQSVMKTRTSANAPS